MYLDRKSTDISIKTQKIQPYTTSEIDDSNF